MLPRGPKGAPFARLVPTAFSGASLLNGVRNVGWSRCKLILLANDWSDGTMTVSADVLRNHLAYTAWASRRLVESAAQLPPEQLTRDFGTADRSILGTLAHVFAADRIWLARITGAAPHSPYQRC